ncbi:MAG: LysR family transcriptional regulator [Veillonellaceae bacterium]|nr:LysR family transcriptional regulator [Veillonellaceae bacterium]
MNGVSTELYRTFYGVGLRLSFSKAAKDIGVSQSAISQSIKQLEKELHMTLFKRTTKSVAFTEEGKELFDTVAQAFAILDNGVIQLQERVNHEQESLILATPDTMCRHYLLPVLKQWQQEEHEVGLRITNAASPECVRLVEEGEAQLAIVNYYDELDQDQHLEVRDLVRVKDIFVGGPRYKEAGPFTMQKLLQEPLLLLASGAASRNFFDTITEHAVKKPAFELTNLDVLLDLVKIDMGIAMVPEQLAKEGLADGSLVKIDTDIMIPDRKIVQVRSRMSPVSSGASKFMDLLHK